MKAKIVESGMYDTVITLMVDKEDFGKLMKKKIDHVWVEYMTDEKDDNSQAGIIAFRLK